MNQGVTRKCNPSFFAHVFGPSLHIISAHHSRADRTTMATDLADIEVDALVFDAYGTLFDVHSVVAAAESLYAGHGVALSQLWRSKQLEYTWLQSLMQTPTRRRQDF